MKKEVVTLWTESVGRGVDLAGGPEAITVGVSLTTSGTGSGHLMLMFDQVTAHAFVDLMMGQPLGTTTEVREFEASALGEIGNIVGSSLLNVLADVTAVRLMPSPPSVVVDMAGTLLDIIAVDAMLASDESFLARAVFRIEETRIRGGFFIVPTPELLELFSPTQVAS